MPVRDSSGRMRRLWLSALCVGLALVEMGVLTASGQARVNSLAPQVSAVPPFGIFHDLRWLFVYHHSWLSFAYEWVAVMAFRSVVTAAMLRLAWPDGYTPPSWTKALARALLFNVVAFVLFSPLVALLFAAGATGLSWAWYACIIPMILFSLIMYPWVISGDWSRWPTFATIGWVLMTWPILGVAGGAIVLVPLWAGFLLDALFGLYNARAWQAVTTGIILAPRPHRFRPLPVLSVVVIYGLLLGALGYGVGAVTPSGNVPAVAQAGRPQPGRTLLVVFGLDSSWTGNSLPAITRFQGRLHTTVFSYSGLDAGGAPLPYPPRATRVPLYPQVAKLADQVDSLVKQGAGPIWILADSEGSLITQLYLAAYPDAPVKRVLITSPEIAAAMVYFPQIGRQGWGAVTGMVVQGWYRYFDTMGWAPSLRVVLRTMLDHGPVMNQLERCSMGVRDHTVLLPLSATVNMPFDLETRVPVYIAGTVHGGLLQAHRFSPVIGTVLSGERPRYSGWWNAAAWLGRASGSSWRVPPLVRTFPAEWRTAVGTAELDCRTVQRQVQAALGRAGSGPQRSPAASGREAPQ